MTTTQTTGTAVRNWAGNVTFRARELHRPESVAQLQADVTGADRVRALGSGHSFSRIADTGGTLIRTDGLPPLVEVDTDAATVTVSAGTTYGTLAPRLHEAGLALPSMGSLPHISIAGATATGTHGSGDGNHVLAASVVALQMVTASGDLVELERGRDEDFTGAVVALGALGVVTRLTLACVPTFDLAQEIRERLPLPRLVGGLDEVMAAGYSVSAFTDWTDPVTATVWLKRSLGSDDLPGDWLGSVVADGARHPVPGMPTDHATQQLGVPGPWHERLPHFRMDFTPSAGEELQSEYLVPREHGAAAVEAVASLGDRIAPVLMIGELRTIGADDLWLSAAHGRDSLALHFTWHPDEAAVAPVLAEIERVLAPFGARPHWGKVFRTDPDVVRGLYPRMADFVALRDRLDPGRRFANEFVDRYLGD